MILPRKYFQKSFLKSYIAIPAIWRGGWIPDAYIDFSWEYSDLALSYLKVIDS